MRQRMSPAEQKARRQLARILKDRARRDAIRAMALDDADYTDAHDTSGTIPTPEEIAERCEAIQAGWGPLEKARRVVTPPEPCDLPQTKYTPSKTPRGN